MKTRNSFQTENTKLIICSQIDNIEREGFVSIQDSYNEFINAGRQQIEYLKQKYPSSVNQRVDEFNMQKENEDFLKDINKSIRNEDLDGVDYAREINKQGEIARTSYNQLLEEQRIEQEVRQKFNMQQEAGEQKVDQKTE